MESEIFAEGRFILLEKNKKKSDMVSERYEFIARELLKRLRSRKDELDLTCVDFEKPFPCDQFIQVNKGVKDIVKDIETEFQYEMSEYQCSWAVTSLIRGEEVQNLFFPTVLGSGEKK